MRTRYLTAALLLCTPAAATGLGTQTGSYSVEYTGYSHGLTVLKLAGTVRLSQASYSAHVTFHTAGMIGMVVHSDNDSQASGGFDGDRAIPALFEGTGHLRGTDRATRITYVDGNPKIETLQPPVEHERSPVAPADTMHTIDTLSAVALLIRGVARSGTCDGTVTTFDGRRLATQTSHTTGQETLPATGRSVFQGPALRCDFDGRQLAGFVNDENEDSLRKPRHGTAWLAAIVAGAPPVPVRVAFENKILGQVTLYLTRVSGDTPIAAKPIP